MNIWLKSMKLKNSLILRGITLNDIFLGIKCDIEGVKYHSLNKDGQLVLIGQFNELSNEHIIFEKLLNSKSQKLKYRDRSIMVFELTDYFIKKYNAIMQNEKITYVSGYSEYIKVSGNIFNCSPMTMYCSDIYATAFFDYSFNLMNEPRINNNCYIVLPDISKFKHNQIKEAYEILSCEV